MTTMKWPAVPSEVIEVNLVGYGEEAFVELSLHKSSP
jgi:hypothetical protein